MYTEIVCTKDYTTFGGAFRTEDAESICPVSFNSWQSFCPYKLHGDGRWWLLFMCQSCCWNWQDIWLVNNIHYYCPIWSILPSSRSEYGLTACIMPQQPIRLNMVRLVEICASDVTFNKHPVDLDGLLHYSRT